MYIHLFEKDNTNIKKVINEVIEVSNKNYDIPIFLLN